jgi:hypothetical protein
MDVACGERRRSPQLQIEPWVAILLPRRSPAAARDDVLATERRPVRELDEKRMRGLEPMTFCMARPIEDSARTTTLLRNGTLSGGF